MYEPSLPNKTVEIMSRVGCPSVPPYLRAPDFDLGIPGETDSSTSGSVFITEPKVIAAVISQYRCHSSFEAGRFLKTEPAIARFLASARSEIAGYFGSNAAPSLEFAAEHVSGRSNDTDIVISIRSYETVEKTLERLDRFYQEWWLNMPANLRTRVTFVLEYA